MLTYFQPYQNTPQTREAAAILNVAYHAYLSTILAGIDAQNGVPRSESIEYCAGRVTEIVMAMFPSEQGGFDEQIGWFERAAETLGLEYLPEGQAVLKVART